MISFFIALGLFFNSQYSVIGSVNQAAQPGLNAQTEIVSARTSTSSTQFNSTKVLAVKNIQNQEKAESAQEANVSGIFHLI